MYGHQSVSRMIALSPSPRKLLTLETQIEGRSAFVTVYSNTNLLGISQEIADAYNLDPAVVPCLRSVLEQRLRTLINRQREGSPSWRRQIQRVISGEESPIANIQQSVSNRATNKHRHAEERNTSQIYDEMLSQQEVHNNQGELQQTLFQYRSNKRDCRSNFVGSQSSSKLNKQNINNRTNRTNNNQKKADPSHRKTADSQNNKPKVGVYQKCLVQMQKKVALTRKKIQEDMKKQIEFCTFKPNINKKSRLLTVNNTTDASVHESLYKEAKVFEQRIERLRSQKQRAIQQSLTFTPELNQTSMLIVNQKRDKSGERSHKDYSSSSRQKLQKLMEEQQMKFTFSPGLSRGTQQMVKKKGLPKFPQRLQTYLEKMKRVHTMPAQEMSHQSDSHKFSPLNKSKEFYQDKQKDRERRNRLYNLNPKQYFSNQSALNASDIYPKTSPSGPSKSKITENKVSDQLYLRRKHRVFNLLFDSLEQNGMVGPQDFYTHIIQSNIYHVLLPFIEEILELDVSLNRIEFVNSINKFFETLNPADKDILLNCETRAKWLEERRSEKSKYTFTPELCNRSLNIAQRKRLLQETAGWPMGGVRRNYEEEQEVSANSDSQTEEEYKDDELLLIEEESSQGIYCSDSRASRS